MEEKLKEFFRVEKTYIKAGLDKEDDPKRRSEICWNARQRALGAVDLAQLCGLDYEIAKRMFYQHCKEVEEMEYE